MDYKIFEAALGQTMSKIKNGQVVIPAQTTVTSTHHNPKGTMGKVLELAKQKGWPVHRWGYQETSAPDGWLLPAEVEKKRRDIPGKMWEVEYDLERPSAEGLAILTEAVEALFSPTLGTYAGRVGEYIEIQKPKPGGRYATGADWAKKQDLTAIMTCRTDWQPQKLIVAYEHRNREPWPRMVGRFDARLERYGGKAAHDETGVGNVVADYMRANAAGVTMVGRTRKDLFTEWIAAIEGGEYIGPRITSVYSDYRYVTVDELYGSGHPPDSVVAGAMMHRAAKRRSGGRGT